MLHVPREDWLNHRDSMNGQLDFLRRPRNSSAAKQSVSTAQPSPTTETVKQDGKGCQNILIVIIVLELIIIIGGSATFALLSIGESSLPCRNRTLAGESTSMNETQGFNVRSTIKGQSITNVTSVPADKFHNVYLMGLAAHIIY